MIVKTSSAMAAVDSSSPGTSDRAACGSFEVGTLIAASRIAAAATGPMATKMLAQLKCSSSQPPTIGPERDRDAGDRAPQADRPGSLCARGEDVRDQRQRRRERHRRAEAHDRARGDQQGRAGGEASGHARRAEDREAREQHPLAAERGRDRDPHVSSSAAKTRLYASTTHWSWLVDACSSRTSVGRATLTSVVSRLMANAASSSATRIIGFDRILEILNG